MKKILVFLMITVLTVMSADARGAKGDFSGVVREFGVARGSVAISIKNADTGKTVYALNERILMHPASVQKMLTMPVAYGMLGGDYKFSTKLYKRGETTYVIKLSGDPWLTSKELKYLILPVAQDATHIYIDDTVLDNKTWGEGWQWDDDLNSLMPRFGAYNLDKNIVKLNIMPEKGGEGIKISNPSKYPMAVFNNLKNGGNTEIKVERDSSISDNAIKLTGTVARQTTVNIPVNNIKRYFETKLTQNLESRNVYIKDSYTQDTVKSSDKALNDVIHELTPVIEDILKNSNNMSAETVFKLAGGKYVKGQGSDTSAVKLFKEYCENNGLDATEIRIVDGSGVSKNNLVTADFVSNFLIINKDNQLMEKLPKPGEGTLSQRLLTVKDNLRAKTGTLSDVSSIAGYITSRKGKKYVFCIMINDTKLSPSDKKMLEDGIIREAYMKL